MKYYLLLINILIVFKAFGQDYIDQKYDQQRILLNRGGGGCENFDTTIKEIKYGTVFDFSSDTLMLSSFEDERFRYYPFGFHSSQICNKSGKNIAFFNGIYLMDQFGLSTRMDVFGSFEPYPFETLNIRNSSVILPFPGIDSTYILIGTNDHQDHPNFVIPVPNVISAVTFKENNLGKLDIINEQKEVARGEFSSNVVISSCRHANGRDWWIICANRLSMNFTSLLLDPSGLKFNETYNAGDSVLAYNTFSSGFSPDGNFYARTAGENKNPPSQFRKHNRAQIFKFDRCSGRLFDPINFYMPDEDTANISQVLFDKNSSRAYIPTGGGVWQGDMSAVDVPNSFKKVGYMDHDKIEKFTPLYVGVGFQGPDNKMYFFDDNNKFGVSVINHPELEGTACEFEYSAFYKPSCTGMSVGNMPYFSLGPLDGSPCDTLGLDNPLTTIVKKPFIQKQIYPNPTTGLIYLDLDPALHNLDVKILDIQGRVILNTKGIDLHRGVDLNFFTNGIYFVKVGGGVRKVLKI